MTTASGTISRVRLRREGHAMSVKGNLITYSPETGSFTAVFDFQPKGSEHYNFTPVPSDSPEAQAFAVESQTSLFKDQFGLIWELMP
jgi:hypothetical protein